MRLIVSQMPYHPEWDYDTAIQKNLPKKEDITQETFMSRRLTKEGTGSYPLIPRFIITEKGLSKLTSSTKLLFRN